MIREQKNIYCFIFDENNNYYRAQQQFDGSYKFMPSKQPYPLEYNPVNLLKSKVEFASNMEYFSMVRSIDYPLDFIKDGAAILRKFYHLGKRVSQKLYFTIIEWNGKIYDLSYTGEFDFSVKTEDPKSGTFTVPLTDTSAWGILSKYDKVKFAIDCSEHNPKAVKVLLDGITIENKYTFQTVQSPIINSTADQFHLIPFVLVNQDGDSSGILTKNQSGQYYGSTGVFTPPQNSEFFHTFYSINGVQVSGTFDFEWSTNYIQSGGLVIFFSRMVGTTETRINIFSMPGSTGHLILGKRYTVTFDFTINMVADERLFFVANMTDNAGNNFTITPIVSNIFIKTKTVPQPKIVYGLRAGDLLQQIVNLATYGKHTIGSNFFTLNNKSVCLSGDAIRGVPNAQIYTSFADFFKTFDSINWMALRTINGLLWMEKSIEVYKNNGVLIDLGEAIDVKLSPAMEFYCNEIQVGSPKQDLRHPSGRLAFNSTNTFSVPILSSDKKLDIVTEYITDCYTIQFLLLDYEGSSTQDNQGDKKVYVLDISDTQGTAVNNIETFENVNIDNVILSPIIKSPLSNDVINFNKPLIKGIAPVGSNINIYCDTVLDGSTTADANGNWSYNINTALQSYDGLTHTGVHNIEATYTDLLAAKTTIVVTINTTVTCPTLITYPQKDDSLYNNKPLIKGVSQAGQVINIIIDGILVNSTVADNSCKWEYKSAVIFNGDHVLQVGTDSVNFHLDTNVDHPLITYLGSELDGFAIVNNLPLIQGVSKPFEYVEVFLNYISYSSLGKVQADGNGNWSLQVSPINYIDPNSGSSVILAPVQNGLNIFSTSLVNYTVGINVTGYKLNRPNFSSINGVVDNSVFNVNFSPKRMLGARNPLWAAILKGQPNEFLYAQTFGQNGNLVTVLGNEVISERSDVSVQQLGDPFAILEWANVKVKALKSFINTLYDFNNGGVLKFRYRGKSFYALAGIGSMKLNSIIDTEQQWKVLLSTLTSYTDILNLYNNGLNIKLDNMSFYHSDRNSIHFVEYGFHPNQKYHTKTMYQDWFNNRNDFYLLNPDYIHKFQTSENDIRDQIITRGISSAALKMYRCLDGTFVDAIPYAPVNPAPIDPPELVMEAIIHFSAYPPDQYFFVLIINDIEILISERVETRVFWPKSILIEASSTINQVDAFYSSGFKTVIRVEGIVKKSQPEININSVSDDIGNNEMLYSSNYRSNIIRFGTAKGLPDYIYLKIADAISLDNVAIDNTNYVLPNEEKIQFADEVDGHPMYYYNVKMYPQSNKKGIASVADQSADSGSVILVVDATAFGLPRGSLINIELNG